MLFIGANDKGEIQPKDDNFEKLQKTLSDKLEEVYPPVYRQNRTVIEHGRECLLVIVPGSTNKPHFTGSPYLRDGAKTVKAQPSQYDALIVWRLDKARELQQWIDKPITLKTFRRASGMGYKVREDSNQATVSACNQFYVTLEYRNRTWSFPLPHVIVSYDHVANRLQVEYTYTESEGCSSHLQGHHR